jgi:hypothetical protein
MTKTKMKLMTETLNSTKGRFFGITTTQGDKVNAQLRGISNCYVTIYDRSSKTERKINKNSVASITTQGETQMFG